MAEDERRGGSLDPAFDSPVPDNAPASANPVGGARRRWPRLDGRARREIILALALLFGRSGAVRREVCVPAVRKK